MRVRLLVKLAERVEGIDLSPYSEGDLVELKDPDARLLIAGGWAECVKEQRVSSFGGWRSDIAADRS
jgi:hypothetical protein